jgi:hypothetical protein
MTTTINFYEGSQLFLNIETDKRVGTGFIEYKLAKQYEYRETTESLWATVIEEGTEVSRYELKYGDGLYEIVF